MLLATWEVLNDPPGKWNFGCVSSTISELPMKISLASWIASLNNNNNNNNDNSNNIKYYN